MSAESSKGSKEKKAKTESGPAELLASICPPKDGSKFGPLYVLAGREWQLCWCVVRNNYLFQYASIAVCAQPNLTDSTEQMASEKRNHVCGVRAHRINGP